MFDPWGSPKKRMVTHSSILAWRIPWTEESSELESMGSQAIGHDLAMNTFTLFFKGRGGLAQLVPTAPTPLHHTTA